MPKTCVKKDLVILPDRCIASATALPCDIFEQEDIPRGYKNYLAMREWLRSGSIDVGMTSGFTIRRRWELKRPNEE